MDTVSYWIAAAALLGSGIIYVHTIEARGKRGKRLLLAVLAYFLCGGDQQAEGRNVVLVLFVIAVSRSFVFGMHSAYGAGTVMDGGGLLCDLGVYVVAVIAGAVSGL